MEELIKTIQINKSFVSNPEFIIFTGPMFGAKSSRLLTAVDRFHYQNKTVLAFKSKLDQRYSKSEISTHNGGRLSANLASTGKDILDKVNDEDQNRYVDVVAVDEAFMIEGCADILIELFKRGKTIIVASIQLSASGQVFEEIRDMMPWATKIEVCPAVCTVTGLDAYYTHRKFTDMSEIAVGGSELYEPRCWHYHGFMNKKQ